MFQEYTQQENIGRVARVMMVPDEIGSVDVFGDVIIADGASVDEIIFSHGAAMLDFEVVETVNGPKYSYSIKLKVPKFSAEFNEWAKTNSGKRWIVFIEDANELVHVIGNNKNGCIMTAGGGVSGQSFVNINFGWQGGEAAWCLEGMNLNEIEAMGRIIDLRKYDVRDIMAVKGDSLSLDIQFEQADGTAEDLVSNTFSCKVKDAAGTEVLAFAIGSGFTLTNANKTLVMAKTAAQMAAVAAGEYVYDIQRTYPSTAVETVLKGKFIVESDIS